jgi:RimJ/RimL family protein N-acetyltransferase
MTELRTPRLVLRTPTRADAPSYVLGVGEYAVARHLTGLPYPYSLAMAIDWLGQSGDASPERAVLVVELPGKGVIGGVSLLDELGFWIARPFWNRGYATEAAAGLIDWHFAGCTAPHVRASAHHDNFASLAVQAKLGFRSCGREKRFSHALQHNVDHVVTMLDRGSWHERKAG